MDFIIYRIYYGPTLIAYVGQTTQGIEKRLYQHFFSNVDLSFTDVKKIEYAKCKSRADMNLYEIYYINKDKPFENLNYISKDELTVSLPPLEFVDFDLNLLSKYKVNDRHIMNRNIKSNSNVTY